MGGNRRGLMSLITRNGPAVADITLVLVPLLGHERGPRSRADGVDASGCAAGHGKSGVGCRVSRTCKSGKASREWHEANDRTRSRCRSGDKRSALCG